MTERSTTKGDAGRGHIPEKSVTSAEKVAGIHSTTIRGQACSLYLKSRLSSSSAESRSVHGELSRISRSSGS